MSRSLVHKLHSLTATRLVLRPTQQCLQFATQFSTKATRLMWVTGMTGIACGLLTLGILTGCAKQATPIASAVPAPPYDPIASIQDIMQTLVDPSADALWESVETTVTIKGTEEKQPRTDDEWRAVRHDAIRLIEATNLLVTPNRKVVEAGKPLEDAHVAGINKPEEIQHLIDSDPQAFQTYAVALRAASVAALQAIDKRDTHALIDAGGAMDHACEQCHLHYWYPNTFRPK